MHKIENFVHVKLRGWRRFWPPARRRARIAEYICNYFVKEFHEDIRFLVMREVIFGIKPTKTDYDWIWDKYSRRIT